MFCLGPTRPASRRLNSFSHQTARLCRILQAEEEQFASAAGGSLGPPGTAILTLQELHLDLQL